MESTATHNPYAPPSADVTPEAPVDAVAIRNEHLTHETSIKAMGALYIFSAIVATLGTVAVLVMSVISIIKSGLSGPENGGILLVGAVLYGLFAALSWYLGLGLRKLLPKVRIGTTILAVLGLFGFPIGTIFNMYLLYLLHSQKGKRIFSPEYQGVIEATPHIKYKTPLWLKILAVLIIALVLLGIVMAAVNL